METPVPEFVVIVPYRNRPQQLAEFDTHMRAVLAPYDSDTQQSNYRVWYMHQCDDRPFNRGAMKNLGFIVLRNMYPHTYSQITLVFHDIDTVPTGPDVIPDYRTTPGIVKHFYGYRHALGGIVSIRAGDFERIGGFPNYWAWGYEDNMLQTRVMKAPDMDVVSEADDSHACSDGRPKIVRRNMAIDRTTFYPINDAVHIRQDRGGRTRTVNRGEFDRYMRMDPEGIHTLSGVVYDAPRSIGLGQGDTILQQLSLGEMVDVRTFDTGTECNTRLNTDFDAARGQAPFTVGRSARMRTRMNLVL